MEPLKKRRASMGGCWNIWCPVQHVLPLRPPSCVTGYHKGPPRESGVTCLLECDTSKGGSLVVLVSWYSLNTGQVLGQGGVEPDHSL
jgi:hypothetical protein